MFKLVILYAILLEPGYQLNQAETTTGLKTEAHCKAFGEIMAATIRQRSHVIKGSGSWNCVKTK